MRCGRDGVPLRTSSRRPRRHPLPGPADPPARHPQRTHPRVPQRRLTKITTAEEAAGRRCTGLLEPHRPHGDRRYLSGSVWRCGAPAGPIRTSSQIVPADLSADLHRHAVMALVTVAEPGLAATGAAGCDVCRAGSDSTQGEFDSAAAGARDAGVGRCDPRSPCGGQDIRRTAGEVRPVCAVQRDHNRGAHRGRDGRVVRTLVQPEGCGRWRGRRNRPCSVGAARRGDGESQACGEAECRVGARERHERDPFQAVRADGTGPPRQWFPAGAERVVLCQGVPMGQEAFRAVSSTTKLVCRLESSVPVNFRVTV